jgi:hypothetical protein
MGFFHKDNVFMDNLIACVLLCGIWTIFALVLWIGAGYTDLSCSRSTVGVECTFQRTYQFSKSSEVRIYNPISVDIDEYKIPETGTVFVKIDVRSRDVLSKVNIYHGYNLKNAYNIAKEINRFLISSNTPSFHTRF